MKNFMQIAIDEAYKGINSGHGGPFGAVIVKGDNIVSKDHNTVLRDKDPVQHAETRAISEASRKLGTHDLGGCVIYSTTEPCPMCFSAIHWANIDEVYFGTRIEDVQKLGFNELTVSVDKMKDIGGSGVLIKPGFMRDECLELLQYWNVSPGRQTY